MKNKEINKATFGERNTVSPSGLHYQTVSPSGLHRFFTILLIFVASMSFGQTESKYEVSIASNIKLNFPNCTVTKTQPDRGFRYYEIITSDQTSAGNGLSLNGNTVQLGGTLSQNTNVALNTFNLALTGTLSTTNFTGTGRLGINTATPTSYLHVNGSISGAVRVINASTSLTDTDYMIVVNAGAINVTITLPNPLTVLGRTYIISRYANSTGTITLTTPVGSSIQALAGTVGTTTTLGAHSATGAGLNHSFTAISIGGVGVWVRI